MRVVLDTNVWISGMLWRGAPWQVLRLAESGRIAIWATAGIMQEVQDTLSYPPAASDVVDTYSDT